VPDPQTAALADPTHHGIPENVYRRRWWILAVLNISLLIVFVGNSSLNVAIPTLSRQLHASESQLQWVVAVYSLVFAGLLFTTGALGDRFGRKGALQLGLLLFMVGCVAASMSTTMAQLIACRAVMGAAAALIMPSTLSLLVNVFPPHERTKAIAIWAGIAGSAGAIGPVASGLLLNHFWFGSVFLINIPICAIALVTGWFLLPKSKDPEQGQLDPVGALLSIVAISSIVYGLIEAPDKGWAANSTIASFVIGAVGLVLFVMWEHRSKEPMLDIRYFRNGAFSASTSGMILVFMAMFGVMFLITQFFQLILGYSPLGTALRFLPMVPIMMIVAPLTPKISARFGTNRVVAAGLVLVAVGLTVYRSLTPHTPYALIVCALVPLVGGMALGMSPMTAGIMSAVPPRRAGAGSAMNDATRELGTALGVAVMGSLAASKYGAAIDKVTVGLPADVRRSARSSLAGALQAAQNQTPDVARRITTGAFDAFVNGVHLAVTVGAVLALVAAAVVLRYLPRQLAHQGAMHGGVDSLEDALQLGIAGVEPVFADEHFVSDDPLDERRAAAARPD
jgi:EmrB/QacA subfamily drug resistance transporter